MGKEYNIALNVARDKLPREMVKEFMLFHRMARRSDAITDTIPILLQEPDQRVKEIRIAAISLDIEKERDLEAYPRNDVFGVDYLLHCLKPKAYARLSRSLFRNIHAAVEEHGAHFVCAGELCYPWCSPAHPDFDSKHKAFQQKVLRLARRHQAYIVAGTHHCTETLHNLAVLFHPGPEPSRNPYRHAKKTSAHSIEEIIRIPYSRNLRIYKTKYARIGILICLDSYDPSLVMGLVRAKHIKPGSDHNLEVVFVPSFNPSPGTGVKACEDLSYLLANVVVLVNARGYGGDDFTVFKCGVRMKKPAEAKIINDELRLYTIDVNRLKRQSTDLIRDRSQTFNTIFGIRNSVTEEL